MSERRYVALLRGINVGGANIIKMSELRTSFEELGFAEVETYIASGNVVFVSKTKATAKLVTKIERALSEAFAYSSRVVLVSAEALRQVVEQAPKGFGTTPAEYRYDVLFLKEPLTPAAALRQIATNPAVDAVAAGDHALYFRRLISKATQSRLPKLIQLPIYKSMTIRNWNTTTKLLAMLGD